MKVTCAEFNCHTDSACIATFKVEKSGLLTTVPSSSIASEFKLLGSLTSLYKREDHNAKYTPKQKALIAKRAAEHGVIASYHRFYQRINLAFEIVLCADPLPTRFDSLAIHENITTNIIVFNDSRNYYPSKNLRYTVI